MRFLLSCATPTEAKPLRSLLSTVAGARRFGNTWTWQHGEDCFELLVTGISAPSLTESLRHLRTNENGSTSSHCDPVDDASGLRRKTLRLDSGPDVVVVFGLAGGLQPGAKIGTIVIPQEWHSEGQAHALICCEDLLRQAARVSGPDQAVCIGGAGVTLRRPALSPQQRAEVRRKFPGTLICDMESYFVMQRFRRRFLGIRIVSDDGSELQTDFREQSSVLAQFVFRFLLSMSEDR